MPDIKVIKEFNAPIEKVWGYLQDHEGYAQFPYVTSARLLKAGETIPHGTGAEREIQCLGITLVEKITWYEAPTKLDYHIIRASIPVSHRYGMIRLKEKNGITTVVWESGFDAEIPFLAPVAGMLLAPVLSMVLESFLSYIKKRVEAPF